MLSGLPLRIPNIKGIYINIAGSGAVNYGNMEELRSELLRFKESGKFVVAYNEVYSQLAYWLSSAADRVFIHPEGFMDWRGVAANVMFYKGLLDKLGVDVENYPARYVQVGGGALYHRPDESGQPFADDHPRQFPVGCHAGGYFRVPRHTGR